MNIFISVGNLPVHYRVDLIIITAMFCSPYDVVRYVQEKKVTVENSFDFIDIEKTLTQVSQGEMVI